MRSILVGLASLCCTATAPATTLHFDGIPLRDPVTMVMTYSEQGYTVTSVPTPFFRDFNLGASASWTIEGGTLNSCGFFENFDCSVTIDRGGQTFYFGGLLAETHQPDFCMFAHQSGGFPVTANDHSAEVGNCHGFRQYFDTFGNEPLTSLTLTTQTFNYIFVDDVQLSLTPIPEPSTYSLMLAGLLLIITNRFNRNR